MDPGTESLFHAVPRRAGTLNAPANSTIGPVRQVPGGQVVCDMGLSEETLRPRQQDIRSSRSPCCRTNKTGHGTCDGSSARRFLVSTLDSPSPADLKITLCTAKKPRVLPACGILEMFSCDSHVKFRPAGACNGRQPPPRRAKSWPQVNLGVD